MEYFEEILTILQANEGGNYVYISDDDMRLTQMMADLVASVDITDLKTKFYFSSPKGMYKLEGLEFNVAYVDVGAASGIEVNQAIRAKHIKLCQK